ncbi:TetR/AcrR family transcriptional regulator [Williamsia sp. R60]
MDTDAPESERELRTHKRKHAAGESTRVLLMETAEQLFAVRGIEGVTLREIQHAAGQSNSSVITYHFGSKTGLVHALIRHRHAELDKHRLTALAAMRDAGQLIDPRAVVWLIVRPLIGSIRAGEMFVPFLARLSENPRAYADFWPDDVQAWGSAAVEEVVDEALSTLPQRIRRGRAFQLYNSVLNLLGEHARSHHEISEALLHNYVDGWAALLAAPVSDETLALL